MGLFSTLLGNAGIVDKEKLIKKYGQLLIDDETIELGFKLLRDTFIFTTKRLILIDKQGLTGKKLNIFLWPIKAYLNSVLKLPAPLTWKQN